jgi:hypothetical protein
MRRLRWIFITANQKKGTSPETTIEKNTLSVSYEAHRLNVRMSLSPRLGEWLENIKVQLS